MDTAGRKQRLVSETAEERESRLHHGGELVEGSVLLRNRERHASVDVVGYAEQMSDKYANTAPQITILPIAFSSLPLANNAMHSPAST